MNPENELIQDIDQEIKNSKRKNKNSFKGKFETAASNVTRAAGSSTAFLISLVVIILWAVSGPLFNFSDTWQLVINTGTTIITFLMVFVIQQSQNKDSLAIQLKLNELIAANIKASCLNMAVFIWANPNVCPRWWDGQFANTFNLCLVF